MLYFNQASRTSSEKANPRWRITRVSILTAPFLFSNPKIWALNRKVSKNITFEYVISEINDYYHNLLLQRPFGLLLRAEQGVLIFQKEKRRVRPHYRRT